MKIIKQSVPFICAGVIMMPALSKNCMVDAVVGGAMWIGASIMVNNYAK